jgi:cullin-4
MLRDLTMYHGKFETEFIERTQQYYKAEGTRMIGSLAAGNAGSAVAKYLEHVSQRLEQEKERCTPSVGYLNIGTRKPLITAVETELIKNFVTTLLERGMFAWELRIHGVWF